MLLSSLHRAVGALLGAGLALLPVAASATPADASPLSAPVQAQAQDCPTPTDPRPVPDFRDVGASTHADSIVCVARWGIARGTGADTYGPGRNVTRAQMATFVANLVRATGDPLPEGTDRFGDDTGSPHEPNINALANAGIVSGVSEASYGGSREVTRGQAASILAAVYRHVRGTDLPVGLDRFGDDSGSTHEANINRLANAGVISGTSATSFGVGRALRRDQMASLLANFLPLALGADPAPGVGPAGTVHYSEYGELRSIDMADPAARPLVYSFGTVDTFTVNPARGEFVYVDDSRDREGIYEVVVRRLSDTGRVAAFRWDNRCSRTFEALWEAPLASPDGQWFVAEVDNGWPYNLEIRDRNGACVFEFEPGVVASDSWAWFANGDLLVVVATAIDPALPGDWALVRVPRQAIADQSGRVEVLRTYAGDPPTLPAVSNGQDQIAYTFDRDLYVLDIDTGDHHRVARSANDLMWAAFSPDDRQIMVRHRTNEGTAISPSSGRVHLVPNVRGTTTLVQNDGPTQLSIPRLAGEAATSFDTKGPIFWGR